MITPCLVLDSHEKWWPVGVEESLAIYHQTPGERLDFPPNMQQPKDLPPVGYSRVVTGGGLYWSQFWLWYLYNPWSVAGVGVHEGDWEMVQFGCVDKACDRPVLATCSQHHGGGKREFWAMERRKNSPTVYVAEGSHANYFTKGAYNGIDRCDGKGRSLSSIEWRPFGQWASWPGRWGNSGRSPESPGCQHQRWATPHLYHSASK